MIYSCGFLLIDLYPKNLSPMLRYVFALIPGILLFGLFYFMKSGEVNLVLRDF